jgi:hypothetical protein
MSPLSAEELEALRRLAKVAYEFWSTYPDDDDDEATENTGFYRDVLRLIEHHNPRKATP